MPLHSNKTVKFDLISQELFNLSELDLSKGQGVLDPIFQKMLVSD